MLASQRLGQSSTLFRAVALLARHQSLIAILTVREIRDRYIGSVLGILWAILQPLLMMTVLIVIFSHLFGGKAGTAGATPTNIYIAHVIAGYIPWLATASALQGAVSVIRANAGLVKQMEFPTAVLPAKAALSHAPVVVIGLFGLLVYQLLFSSGGLSPLLALLPLVLVLHLAFVVGLCWATASLGAYFRDLDPILSNLLMVNLYLLPIFFLPGTEPQVLKPFIEWNPFNPLVSNYQDILVHHRLPLTELALFAVMALIAFFGGFWLLERARVGFADLL